MNNTPESSSISDTLGDATAAPATPATSAADVPKDQRTMGMLCHLLAFCGFVFPFGGIIAPLVLWLVKKDEMPFVNDQGKEALNFQITVAIAVLICIPLIPALISLTKSG